MPSRLRSRLHPVLRPRLRSGRHLPVRTTVVAAAAFAVAALAADAAGAAAPAEPAPPVSVAMTGVFSFHPCPQGTPAADACLTDHVTGTLPGAGPVSGVFEVHIAFSQGAADHCQPIDKHGSFTTADGRPIELRAAGMYCADEAIASYDYRRTNGPGRGQWLVPAPSSFDSGNGTGTEYFYGSLGD